MTTKFTRDVSDLFRNTGRGLSAPANVLTGAGGNLLTDMGKLGGSLMEGGGALASDLMARAQSGGAPGHDLMMKGVGQVRQAGTAVGNALGNTWDTAADYYGTELDPASEPTFGTRQSPPPPQLPQQSILPYGQTPAPLGSTIPSSAGSSASNPLTLDQQSMMGRTPSRTDQFGKNLPNTSPHMETRADGTQGMATNFAPGTPTARANSLWSAQGAPAQPIGSSSPPGYSATAPSTDAAPPGLPRMIADHGKTPPAAPRQMADMSGTQQG